ncbi:prephenate dehydratase [Stigmatella aurantiaca]|uniref:Prephenate dehydratase n=1 Tax=Stigmatella aurantiaca (strain DW4/3-1) TaxID=378806 RepID=Q098E7_STIAD|nr:prephenate dehydratase [Stigmatella aurantiaca]ADO71440.1 Prephenate dehydratase [Stigmatella aurantiaca DW4/3-1]EAU68101.1 prephenate dehydratase [Stigmatella aurantiaca DW4/3-1]
MSELRIAFQGEHGAYGEQATRALYGPDVEAVPQPSFRSVFEAIVEGHVHGGVVPVENSLAGSVTENVDLLLEFTQPITGELALPIRHCLLVPPGRKLAELERALSHPQALAQCATFLRQHGITPVAEADTAGSARRVAELAPPRTAAIASRIAAELYGLEVLLEGIEDAPDNHTRFVSMGAVPSQPGAQSKTAVAFTLENNPGVLHRVLGAFATRGLSVTRVESRPRRRPWEYVFCLDVEGSQEEPSVAAALDEAALLCRSFRVLGSYRVSAY